MLGRKNAIQIGENAMRFHFFGMEIANCVLQTVHQRQDVSKSVFRYPRESKTLAAGQNYPQGDYLVEAQPRGRVTV